MLLVGAGPPATSLAAVVVEEEELDAGAGDEVVEGEVDGLAARLHNLVRGPGGEEEEAEQRMGILETCFVFYTIWSWVGGRAKQSKAKQSTPHHSAGAPAGSGGEAMQRVS